MAPTEVLARQHFDSITEMFEQYEIPLKVELLTGSMTAKEKRLAYGRIESGQAQIIVGTHALIQEKVTYANLALVVTDEQHRFGVKQREQFAGKGELPHILVMSATPMNFRRTGSRLKTVSLIPVIERRHTSLSDAR